MLKANKDYVVVEVLDRPNESVIVLPEEESSFAKVLDIGPLPKNVKVVFDVGDTVYVDKYGGAKVDYAGRKLQIVHHESILAKVV